MWILVFVLLLLGAHFSLTANVPAEAGKAWVLWPFAADSQPVVALFGTSNTPMQLLSVIAGVAFVAAALALMGWIIPSTWWMPLVLVAVAASSVLFLLYVGPWALIPIAINAVLLWGVLVQHWSAQTLRGI
jgi:hypothetical protein